jgi:hypothetical protein
MRGSWFRKSQTLVDLIVKKKITQKSKYPWIWDPSLAPRGLHYK